MVEKIKNLFELREKIKRLEKSMEEVRAKAEARKQELLAQLSADETYVALGEEYNSISSEYSSTISQFAQENDALITEIGGENV